MSESMGKIIMRLRKERGFTQEELAEKLGVTAQAVSKWENDSGMPDISQIVPLASVFGVKTDVLFGLQTEGADAAIEEVKKITGASETDNDHRIELWADLMKHYPSNNRIRYNLAHQYLRRQKEEDWASAAELYEKILDECTDSEMRIHSLSMLCMCYNRMGDTRNAVRVAKLCGPVHITQDGLLAKIDGYEGRDEVNQRLLAHCVQEAAWCLIRQSYESDADAIFACRSAIRMMDTVYYDGDKSWAVYTYIHLRTKLCRILAGTGDFEALYDELENWLSDVIFADSLPQGECRHPGNVFLNRIVRYHDVTSGWGLKRMRFDLDHPDFDKVRDTEEFRRFWEAAQERYRREVPGA